MGSASKQQGEKSSLIKILFWSTIIILQTVPVFNPYGQINLLSGKGKKDRKSRTATAQWEFTEATASKINHDLVIILSVRSLKWAQSILL